LLITRPNFNYIQKSIINQERPRFISTNLAQKREDFDDPETIPAAGWVEEIPYFYGLNNSPFMKKRFLYFLALSVILINGCQKEFSFETGSTPSEGTLKSDASGDCLPKSVNGTYSVNTPLVTTTNTLSVDVNVTKKGSFTIYTDTVNGYFFRATGIFTTLGVTTITLAGTGTPFTAGTNNFVVHYLTSTCDIAITVTPAGGGGPAVFTHNVSIRVNVATVGTYTISTTFQGMTFSKTGTFSTAGVQAIVLAGSGTPTTAGNNVVPITAGASTCNFTVNVGNPATGTLGGGPGACTPFVIGGTYVVGTPLAAGNTVQIQLTAATAGVYNIATNVVTGFSFAASGNAIVGSNTITLNGTGTPTTAGNQTFTVTFGTSTCTFIINVSASSVATGTLGGAPGACTPVVTAGSYTVGTPLVAGNTAQIQITAATAGTYNITTNTVTGFSFAASGNAVVGSNTITLNGTGSPTTAGTQTFTVTFGTSTCTFTILVTAAPSNDYYPRTVNSNWSYEYDDVPNDSLLRKVIPATHSALGNTYNIFMEDAGAGFDSSGYFRKAGGDYFEYVDLAGFIGFDPPAQWAEYILLKDNVAVGTTWFSSGVTGTITIPPPTTLTIRLKYSILQKDVPITVVSSTGSVTYQNVIVVKEEYQQFVGGTWMDVPQVGSAKSYYARGVGLILLEVFDGTGAPVFKQELRRYQVF
jgi:hypothetical protein